MAAAASTRPSPGRCAIFFYEGYLGVSPTNINLAKALASAGYDVTIYSVPMDGVDAGELPGVKVERLHAGALGERIGALGAGKFRVARIARRLAPLTTPLLFALRALAAEVRAAVAGGGRTVYVGVDLEGGMAAALSSARVMGRGDEVEADRAAVDAMRSALNRMEMSATVVIGEGERDEAPMLYIGEKVGTGSGPALELALDPLEGTTICATGGPNALSVIAAAEMMLGILR